GWRTCAPWPAAVRSGSQRRPPADLALLDARPRRRQHLVRAATALLVERRPQPQHPVEVLRREQLRPEVQLLHAHAVLARDAAARADALVENLVAGRQHALHLVLVALVEEQDRVDVAVAGMEDVANPDIILLADALNLAEDVGQLGPRHDAVLGAVARRQPA